MSTKPIMILDAMAIIAIYGQGVPNIVFICDKSSDHCGENHIR